MLYTSRLQHSSPFSCAVRQNLKIILLVKIQHEQLPAPTRLEYTDQITKTKTKLAILISTMQLSQTQNAYGTFWMLADLRRPPHLLLYT